LGSLVSASKEQSNMMIRSGHLTFRREHTGRRSFASLCSALFLGCVLALPARPAFLDGYAFHNFTLVNVDADGSAAVSSDALSVVITGGNAGTGLPGSTDLTIAALGSGIFSFAYSYSSADPFSAFDWAGYLLGNSFVRLADSDGQSGTVTVPVSAGQKIGWRVETFDNTLEPGILTVSAFAAPAGGAVPEPGSWMLVLAGGAGAASVRRWRNRHASIR
jgi:hypothetical protein